MSLVSSCDKELSHSLHLKCFLLLLRLKGGSARSLSLETKIVLPLLFCLC